MKKTAFQIDHLGLNPEAEFHAQPVHLVDELIHAVGEFFRVHIPVTKACSVVVSSDEPAVVHDEKLHAHGGGPACQLDPARLQRTEKVDEYQEL